MPEQLGQQFWRQWGVDMAYGLWNTEKVSDVKRHNNLALLHAQLNQRLIEDKAAENPMEEASYLQQSVFDGR